MASNPYSLALWNRLLENSPKSIIAGREDSVQLKDISPDVEMDDATITFWNGEKFEDIAAWPAYTVEPAAPTIDPKAERVRAVCGATPVELRRDGSRWLMWAGAVLKRRKDFASPYLEHAQRTAVSWYGEAPGGWAALDRPARKPPGRSEE